MISDWILQLLEVVVEKKLSPTVTSRWLFIFTQLIHDGFQYVTGGGRQLDLFPKSYDSYSVSDIQTWMNMVCNFSYSLVTTSIGGVQTPPSYNNIFLVFFIIIKLLYFIIYQILDRIILRLI